MKRTHLPLNALRVFDAAARHLSFTRAADELAVTPAAVGQQIRALEDVLGVVLFRRTSKGLELTPEGEAGLDPLREGFLSFEESVAAMQAGQSSDRYTIAVPREFFAEWFAPRLARFQADTPKGSGGIQYILSADEHADFTEANLDLAIRLVDGPGELEGIPLAPAMRVTVAAPQHRDAWIDWPGAPLPDGTKPCVKAGSPGQALASALAGMGRTVLPLALAESAIDRGALEVLDGPEPALRGYWLLAPRPQWRSRKVRALVGFLTAA
ncbi:LysR family transcriptional regulator [Porphyrobacter sp. LM 6]|uniref:LysR family transcriptional regulator n=1 Tax=Porphyrobacter sp. LM 6 TaxID=1896196 RepID=UPI0008476B9B|nr:LysR family transcriptional regulator [Porphyrobacter sp. LM 6]AOL95225.1 transcriptional regulator, LysR family [Porphyrobacter sp. LM 6]